MIPTPVLTEYLVGASATEMHELEILKRGFILPGLDVRSAVLAAELLRGGVPNQIKTEFGIAKPLIKVDAQIISIAITNSAIAIITNNINEFKLLSRGKIPIRSVAEILEELTPKPLSVKSSPSANDPRTQRKLFESPGEHNENS